MSFSIPRHQYVIHILDSRAERASPTLSMLQDAGFAPEHFTTMADLLETLSRRPPHAILVHRGEETLNIGECLKELRSRLPETHFLVLSSAGGLAGTWREWGEWIYDCVLSPPVHPRQLVQAIERAAERDALFYRTEELGQKLSDKTAVLPLTTPLDDEATPPTEHPLTHIREDAEQFLASILEEMEPDHAEEPPSLVVAETNSWSFESAWSRLHATKHVEEMVRLTMDLLAEMLGEVPLVFLRYLPNRRCLVTSAAHCLSAEAWKGLGLKLSEEPDFRIGDLRHPEKLASLKEMVLMLGGPPDFWARPLIIREEVYGLFVVLGSPTSLPMARVESILRVAEAHGQLLDLQHYLHAIEVYDPGTHLLNRASFESRLASEIARARRLLSPVTFLLVSLDQHADLLSQYGVEEAQMAMRALGKIIAPRVRVNDTLGKFSAEELGLILPHTPMSGGALKGERLRRLVAAADFGRLLPRFAKLSVSVGVSEYPSCSRDANDLITSADDALWQIKNKTPNKVCVATAASGFAPDFLVSVT